MPFCYYSGNRFCPITVVAERLANIEWGSIGGQKLHFCFVLFVCSALLKVFFSKVYNFLRKSTIFGSGNTGMGQRQREFINKLMAMVSHIYIPTQRVPLPPNWFKSQY